MTEYTPAQLEAWAASKHWDATLIAAAPDLARLVLEKDAEIARLKERIEHAHNTARRFYDTNKSNAGKYFLHICDILEPHCQAMKETSDE